ncbi:MAG: lipoyl(octanoyl) transferase LipB [Actinomycetota bacterium]|nr:lipoyl(octanoyl) transferase LipB [Actinomycetota bacterium]
MKPLLATWLGRIGYAEAFSLQTRLAERVAGGSMPDTLLLLEHEPVYTLGRRASEAEILLDEVALESRGIAVERSDRGGRVTYHGPGQLVGYPIINLGPLADTVGYVRALERSLCSLAAHYGVQAGCIPGLTGLWVGDSKIAAIGVHVSRGVTTHGFAFNVDPDLSAFNGIVPCGIVDRGVTSLSALGMEAPPVRSVAMTMAPLIADELGRSPTFVEPSFLEEGARAEA